MAVDKSLQGRGVNGMIGAAEIGTALAYWVDFGMVFASGQAVWRFPVAFQIFFSILSTAIVWRLPDEKDTPRYYYATGRDLEGDLVLEHLHGAPLESAEVQHDRIEILASLELENSEKVSLRLELLLGHFGHASCAENKDSLDMFYYYETTIFESYIGLPPITSFGLSGAATTCGLISVWITTTLIKKTGRKKWLMWGAVAQRIFTIGFIGLLAHPGHKAGAGAAAMFFCWIVSNGLTWAPLSAVYPSETMPLRYRHIGFSFSISCQWLFAFVTVFAGPIGAAKDHWKILLKANLVLLVYFYCPETRGSSLEEIDLLFMSDRLKQTDAGKKLGLQEAVSEKMTGVVEVEEGDNEIM
ncbi:hypothetical protein MMC08_001120 [Hypocenomyce scalaris]|nr:hypothetical protein [Hypocenomyce scalaris]